LGNGGPVGDEGGGIDSGWRKGEHHLHWGVRGVTGVGLYGKYGSEDPVVRGCHYKVKRAEGGALGLSGIVTIAEGHGQ